MTGWLGGRWRIRSCLQHFLCRYFIQFLINLILFMYRAAVVSLFILLDACKGTLPRIRNTHFKYEALIASEMSKWIYELKIFLWTVYRIHILTSVRYLLGKLRTKHFCETGHKYKMSCNLNDFATTIKEHSQDLYFFMQSNLKIFLILFP